MTLGKRSYEDGVGATDFGSGSSRLDAAPTTVRDPLIRPTEGGFSGSSAGEDPYDDVEFFNQGGMAGLKRVHTKLSMLGLAFAILNSWTALSASLSLALPSGGPSAVVWGLLISGICNLCLAASLGEFLAAWPTAGGQYHWVAMLSPEEWVKPLSWICGWINCSGWVFLTATGGSLGSQLIAGMISLIYPGVELETYQTFLIYSFFIVFAFVVNAFGNKILPLFTKAAFLWSISGFFIISVTVLYNSAPNYQPAGFVFGKVVNETGWPDSIAWLLGLLQGALGLTGYDAVAHMIEGKKEPPSTPPTILINIPLFPRKTEIPNPSKEGPKIMIYAVLIGTATGFTLLTSLLFCMGDLEQVISSPHGPLLEIFYNATGSRVIAVCLDMFPLLCLVFATTGIMTTASRMVYAFARDNGLPFSPQLSKIHPTLSTPLNALILTTTSVLLIGLLYFLSSTAFNAILSASVIALSVSYGFPVVLNLLTRRTLLPPDRSFVLPGWTGWVCNFVGVGFMGVTGILFVLPPVLPVTSENMNYCSVAFAFIVVISTIHYFIRGRQSFEGPKWEEGNKAGERETRGA
ncbi:hypothetical protein RUND412_008523 [Rhizina undulata]